MSPEDFGRFAAEESTETAEQLIGLRDRCQFVAPELIRALRTEDESLA